MGVQFSQMFPPHLSFKFAELPSQKNKVFLITGGTSGIGFEAAKILYAKGGKVYIAGRSREQGHAAIQAVKDAVQHPAEGGKLDFLLLVLDDLTKIKTTVDEFQSKESKLDVLFNNAGVSQPPVGSVSVQNIELQLATNCLGPFLLTKLVQPILNAAATARVVWTSSQVVELSAPPEVMIMSELTSPPKDNVRNYTNSKLGNWFLAVEMARRYGGTGIVSVAQNPGAAKTNLLRNAKWMKILSRPLLHSPEMAAHTMIYAGLSDDLGLHNNGAYIIPWGRIHQAMAPNIVKATKLEDDGGTGRARKFWEFCDEKTEGYVG
jgi:NAD(P)-dependent dehydrogenase (short-subunit alcohol dehydrogenase family)